MSFLAPLFLAGGLLIGLPILFHLIRRTTREVTPFSSLMFLMPTPPRVTKRSRVDNLLLLFLRCLAVLLLAAAFARPLMTWAQKKDPAVTGEGIRTVLLIDNSASMRRAGMWEAAQAKVNEAAAHGSSTFARVICLTCDALYSDPSTRTSKMSKFVDQGSD